MKTKKILVLYYACVVRYFSEQYELFKKEVILLVPTVVNSLG
jgi:hypothetical protein